MKLKDQKKLGILYLVLGAALFLVGLLTDAGEKTNWLSSFGSAIAVVGAARLLRVYRLTRDPDKAADYDASLTDERAAYVANKGKNYTFCGYWKCYGDPAAAQKTFERFRKCTEVYLRCFQSGTPITRLAVAV